MMKIECNQLRDMDSGLTIPVEKIDYNPDDPRARDGVVVFTLDDGRRLEFQLKENGHDYLFTEEPLAIKFSAYMKTVSPAAPSAAYRLDYAASFKTPVKIGCGLACSIYASFSAVLREWPAERDHVSKRDIEELGQTLTTVTVNTGKDIKNTVTGKFNKTATVTQETRAELYGVTDRTIKRWDSGQVKPPEGYDQYADINVIRLNAEKHKNTKKANRSARDYRKYKK